MLNPARLTAKVKAVNRANAYAQELYERLMPIFEPLVGEKILKQDGALLAKIMKLMPELPNTDVLCVFRSLSACSLEFHIRAMEHADDFRGNVYHEAHLYIGELDRGTLVALAQLPNVRSDWTIREVAEGHKKVEEAQEALDNAKRAIHPFF